LVREAAGGIGSRFVDKARELRRLAHARADQVWRDVGERLRMQLALVLRDARRGECQRTAEPNEVLGPGTLAIVESMYEVLALSGYRAVCADVTGHTAPELVHGTVRSHRPSLTAVGGGRPVLVDVYLPGESDPDEHISRWQLFASAASDCGGEFHVVVPSWMEGGSGRRWVRSVTEGSGMVVTKVWEV
jgi:hypothetical protein